MDDVHYSSASAEWYTPPDLFNEWNIKYGPFDLDPCPAATSPIKKLIPISCANKSGLTSSWFGRVYCNPPYGREIGQWTRKAQQEIQNPNTDIIVMLVPARTDTAWWHEAIDAGAQPVFLRGRIKFWGPESPYKSSAPFPSALLIFKKETI